MRCYYNRIFLLLERNITPFSSSRMNMGERGDILEWYGGEDSEPIYLDDDDDDDQEQIAATNQDDESLTKFYLYPVVKKASGNYRMNHLVRLDKKSPDNYRMNHLVRFRVKKASPGYLTRQLRNDKTNVWNKILNRI